MAEGKKLHGSDSAWDVAANAIEHASDINAAALLRHLPAPGTANNTIYDNGANWVGGKLPVVGLAAGTAEGQFVCASANPYPAGWSTLTLPNAATKGDLLVATAANAIGSVVDVAAGQPLLSGGIGLVPVYAGWNLAGTAGQTYTLPAVGGTVLIGTGVVGRVAEWVTNANTLQAAKLIGPAVNILTITNAAASTLALAITAGKTLTLTAVDDFNLTIPATGRTVLWLGAAVTGAVVADPTGGNARGGYTVDLQVYRSADTQVASGLNSVITGGRDNTAPALYGVVCGGYSNISQGVGTTVCGGMGNVAGGLEGTTIGGMYNQALGDYSVACGRRAIIAAAHDGSFLFADWTDANFNSATAGEFAIRARGGFRHAYDDSNYWTAQVSAAGVTTFATLPVGAGFVFTPPVTFSDAITATAVINPFTTAAESWIGPSATTGVYFKGNYVGIGTTNPNYLLQVRDATIASGADGMAVYGYDGAGFFVTTRAESPFNAALSVRNNPVNVAGIGTGITFRAKSDTTNDRMQGEIYTTWTTATDATRTSRMTFRTTNNGTSGDAVTILGSGNVGIGTTTPTAKLHVMGLVDYANNAAAVAAGLTTGAFYTETGTNPKKVCVVT